MRRQVNILFLGKDKQYRKSIKDRFTLDKTTANISSTKSLSKATQHVVENDIDTVVIDVDIPFQESLIPLKNITEDKGISVIVLSSQMVSAPYILQLWPEVIVIDKKKFNNKFVKQILSKLGSTPACQPESLSSSKINPHSLKPLVDKIGRASIGEKRELINELIKIGCDSLSMPAGYFAIVKNGNVEIQVIFDRDKEEIPTGFEISGTVEEVIMDKGEPLGYSPETLRNSKPQNFYFPFHGAESLIGAPVKLDKRIQGILCFYDETNNSHEFIQEQSWFVELLSSVVSILWILGSKKSKPAEITKEVDVDQIIKIASHDLSEPIRIVRNFSQLASKKLKAGNKKDLSSYLDHIEEAGQRLEKVMQDVKKLLSEGEEQVELTEFELSKVLNDVLSKLSPLKNELNAEIIVEELPVVKADYNSLQVVFYNLIENALKFRKKSRKPVIVISYKELEDFWFFSVTDNGIGIESRFQKKVFDLFQKLTSDSSSGIGLSKVQKIVHKHGGTVWMNSIPAYGTTVNFTIRKDL